MVRLKKKKKKTEKEGNICFSDKPGGSGVAFACDQTFFRSRKRAAADLTV